MIDNESIQQIKQQAELKAVPFDVIDACIKCLKQMNEMEEALIVLSNKIQLHKEDINGDRFAVVTCCCQVLKIGCQCFVDELEPYTQGWGLIKKMKVMFDDIEERNALEFADLLKRMGFDPNKK